MQVVLLAKCLLEHTFYWIYIRNGYIKLGNAVTPSVYDWKDHGLTVTRRDDAQLARYETGRISVSGLDFDGVGGNFVPRVTLCRAVKSKSNQAVRLT